LKAHKQPPFRRRRLGRRLRALREAAGLSMDAAAAKLDKSRTSLFRIESGEYRADVHLVRSMMDIYDRWDEGLLEAVRLAHKPNWYATYGIKDFGYIDLETEASRVRDYPGMHLPGLLRTEAYIYALYERARRRRTAEQLRNEVAVRSIRKKRLTDEENPLDFVAIIDEAALRRDIGGPEVMRDQLHHLIEMAALPTVTLQVLELERCPPIALDGAFTLIDFPEPDAPELLYHEYATGALHVEDENEVREAKLVFDSLRSEALNPAESVALIERLATQRLSRS
jgi:transcriptional regulator with XRE-family HTH domain